MSAIDSFEWYVTSSFKDPDPELRKSISEWREYLLTLRSEDERRRFLEGVIDERRQAER